MSVFYNRTRSTKGIPVGSIIPWAGSSADIPAGWLPCNGNQSYRVSDYPLLYRIIGNTYGGTPDISFRVPRLNNGTATPMDIFRGHFYYLNSLGQSQFNDAHRPEKSNITEDEFWKTVGLSESGDKPSTTQTNWVSTTDVVGQQTNVTNLIAKFDDITFIPGEVIQNVFTAGRKLGDEHVPRHGHGLAFSEDDVGFVVGYGNRTAKVCSIRDGSNSCDLRRTCTAVTRAIPKRVFGTQSGMRSLAGSRTGRFSAPGGSNLINRNRGQDRSASIGLAYDGDGVSGGDMRSYRNSVRRYFWSNLDPSGEFDRFSNVAEHNHASVQCSFSSKYIRLINPGIVDNIRLNTVKINNETGRNFGTITANTATPNLSMIYLIRAF